MSVLSQPHFHDKAKAFEYLESIAWADGAACPNCDVIGQRVYDLSGVRGKLLYEAASVILTRSTAESTLRDWGLKLHERISFKRVAIAVARKLAVIMHAMLRFGEPFNRNAGALA